MKKIRKPPMRSVLEIVKECLSQGLKTSEEVHKYLVSNYPHKINPKLPLKHQDTIKTILRKDNSFIKVKYDKTKRKYLWTTLENHNNKIQEEIDNQYEKMTPLKSKSKERVLKKLLYKNVPFYRFDFKTYNSRYTVVEDNAHIEFFMKHGYSVNNIYDFNRNLGDYLRLLFNKGDEKLNIKYDDRLTFPKNFKWGNVNYNMYNFMIMKLIDKDNGIVRLKINENEINELEEVTKDQ